MINFNSIMVGSAQPKEMAEFYKKVFEKDPDMEEDGWYGWQVGGTFYSIGRHSGVNGKANEPQRIILNFETKEVKTEFERMKNAGATVIKEPYEMGGAWIATLADPDGNYFQIMTPWDNINNKLK
ncbi:MAG TPA: VOC family protein [Candidatus Nitrosocosmicus sp.]|nr:VOC family protein [Candidatus Nitrosocosmicus sp.]